MMSVNHGRELGDDGDLMLAHALGVHGLQTMPLLALAVAASTLALAAQLGPCRRCRLAHGLHRRIAAGGVRTKRPTEPAPLSILMLVALLAWSLTTAAALVSSAQSARLRTS